MSRKLVVALTGASGSIYAKLLLDRLVQIEGQWSALDLVLSDNARAVWQTELGNKDYEKYPLPVWHLRDFNAPFASGSAKYDTMIVVPCSMGTLSRIAHGTSDSLLTRAADVVLKERRKLILVARDTPLSLIHLRNMVQITEAGGVICPAIPSYYSNPQSIEEVALTVVDRVLDLAGFDLDSYRWGGG